MRKNIRFIKKEARNLSVGKIYSTMRHLDCKLKLIQIKNPFRLVFKHVGGTNYYVVDHPDNLITFRVKPENIFFEHIQFKYGK